jgi:hypothetical protein
VFQACLRPDRTQVIPNYCKLFNRFCRSGHRLILSAARADERKLARLRRRFRLHPGKETVADTGTRDPPRLDGDAARAHIEDPLASRESGLSNSAPVAAPPGSPLAQPAAKAEAPSPQSETAVSFPPGAPSSHPPARTALEPPRGSGSPGLSAPAMPLARLAPFSAADVPAAGATKSRPIRDGRSHHSQTASRHWHPRSVHSAAALTPPQIGPFDRLLAVLTGRSESLTPPRAQ